MVLKIMKVLAVSFPIESPGATLGKISANFSSTLPNDKRPTNAGTRIASIDNADKETNLVQRCMYDSEPANPRRRFYAYY